MTAGTVSEKVAREISLSARVNDQDVLEVRTGLDDKDWCRGEKRGKKSQELAAVVKNSQAIGNGPCVFSVR